MYTEGYITNTIVFLSAAYMLYLLLKFAFGREKYMVCSICNNVMPVSQGMSAINCCHACKDRMLENYKEHFVIRISMHNGMPVSKIIDELDKLPNHEISSEGEDYKPCSTSKHYHPRSMRYVRSFTTGQKSTTS